LSTRTNNALAQSFVPNDLSQLSSISGRERWFEGQPVVQEMSPLPLIVLVNQRLQVQNDALPHQVDFHEAADSDELRAAMDSAAELMGNAGRD
jgi:hypothetical protein